MRGGIQCHVPYNNNIEVAQNKTYAIINVIRITVPEILSLCLRIHSKTEKDRENTDSTCSMCPIYTLSSMLVQV